MSDEIHTWSYLCDTCRWDGYTEGIFGLPSTEWECWADWEDDRPFTKKAINGTQHPAKVCRNYRPKAVKR